VAEALDALHAAGWMHADVKPSNVFVSSSGHVTLIDLGFARSADERGSIADRPLLGTLNYMAPEVLYSSRGGDIRSDVYSLGVTLFEMLTGRLPFDSQDVAELASQQRAHARRAAGASNAVEGAAASTAATRRRPAPGANRN
jgi:serine/threonine protein kinase